MIALLLRLINGLTGPRSILGTKNAVLTNAMATGTVIASDRILTAVRVRLDVARAARRWQTASSTANVMR